MKINLEKLRAAGFHISVTENVITLQGDVPVPESVLKIIRSMVRDPMGQDLIVGAFYAAVEKAQLLDNLE